MLNDASSCRIIFEDRRCGHPMPKRHPVKRDSMIQISARVIMILTVTAPLAFGSAVAPATSPAQSTFIWALMGDRMGRLDAERMAGVTARVVRISWKDSEPTQDAENPKYVDSKRQEFDRLHAAGFQVIADIGLQDTPPWIHQTCTDSYYVDQFKDTYNPGEVDSGDANLVFNQQVQTLAERYLRRLLDDLGTRIDFIRIGGGHWGELTYPSMRYRGHTNCYWAFDRQALRTNPVPAWSPGDASPHGEARLFINWYLDQLANYQLWQIGVVRRSFSKPMMILYPSWGIRPGQLNTAIADNLSGTSSAEINGEVPRGFDFARQIDRLTDANLFLSSTWLDADGSGDDTIDQTRWSPIHYLAHLARAHHPNLRLFGENTGQGSAAKLAFTVSQARRFGLCGFAWFNQEELENRSGFATLNDFHSFARDSNPSTSR
jgi:hypothetical protein